MDARRMATRSWIATETFVALVYLSPGTQSQVYSHWNVHRSNHHEQAWSVARTASVSGVQVCSSVVDTIQSVFQRPDVPLCGRSENTTSSGLDPVFGI
jgi:hypothetical protein